jgi:ribosomal protein L4
MAANTLDVVDAKGKKAGSVELPGAIFDVQTNVPLIHQVVTAQLAAARQGTHKTKGRGEVSGAGRKPFKQKGTGRARQGSIRAPQHTGGGIVHGPVPRDYSQRTPKKMIAAALLGVLSDRARGERLHIVESFGLERALDQDRHRAARDASRPARTCSSFSSAMTTSASRACATSARARAVRRPAERVRRRRQRRHRLHQGAFDAFVAVEESQATEEAAK